MDARVVALAGYQGMRHCCGIVTPGLLNKFLAISLLHRPSRRRLTTLFCRIEVNRVFELGAEFLLSGRQLQGLKFSFAP
jgi:hypothetical protein